MAHFLLDYLDVLVARCGNCDRLVVIGVKVRMSWTRSLGLIAQFFRLELLKILGLLPMG